LSPSDARARVLIVGPGAVGSLLGGTLAVAGHEVTLLGRRTVEGDDATSLVIEGPDGTRTVPVRRTTDPAAAGTPDLIIVAVRAFDLDAALATAARWPDAPLLTAQNGIGAEEAARAARSSTLLAGSLTTAVEPIPGGVRRLRAGGMGVAIVPGDGAAAGGALAALLAGSWTAAGLPTRLYPDAVAMKWSKLIANIVGNATSAILDLSPGEVYADRRTFPIERRQIHEAVAVMRALGMRPVALPGAHVQALLWGLALPEVVGRQVVARAVAGARGGKSPSLRLHVAGGNTGPTEARWLNGAVAATGARLSTRASPPW
jgi:2-dehydropantoate 2-reductase